LRALASADAHLAAAAHESGRWEFFAEELRLAHAALGSVTGEFSADDLLGEIFSRFCIGK
jgi:tRNA modification GTPase